MPQVPSEDVRRKTGVLPQNLEPRIGDVTSYWAACEIWPFGFWWGGCCHSTAPRQLIQTVINAWIRVLHHMRKTYKVRLTLWTFAPISRDTTVTFRHIGTFIYLFFLDQFIFLLVGSKCVNLQTLVQASKIKTNWQRSSVCAHPKQTYQHFNRYGGLFFVCSAFTITAQNEGVVVLQRRRSNRSRKQGASLTLQWWHIFGFELVCFISSMQISKLAKKI